MLVACSYQRSFCFCSVGPPPSPPPSACVRRSLLGWLPLLNIQACRPLPPLRRRKASAETLARFQGGSDPAATSITSSPLGSYPGSVQTTPAFLLLRAGEIVFHSVFICAGFGAWGFSPPRRALICTNTKQRCEAAPGEPWGAFLRADGTLFLSDALTCPILIPGVVYWTVSNSTAGFQSAVQRSG